MCPLFGQIDPLFVLEPESCLVKSPLYPLSKKKNAKASPAKRHPKQGLLVQDAMHSIDSDGANAGGHGIGQAPGCSHILMDGKSTGNHGFDHQIWTCPVKMFH